MRLLVTGACGFVGSSLLVRLRQAYPKSKLALVGIDNLWRPGASRNVEKLHSLDVQFLHADVRLSSDLENLERCDWIIDAAANASVLAGSSCSSRTLMETNLLGTINLLELCRRWSAGFVLLSSSRVYGIQDLSRLPMSVVDAAFSPASLVSQVPSVSASGINESFPTTAPVSLYGATKLASETLAIEYSLTFDFPAWINRCGVLAGARQFGKSDQGIFSYWLHSWRNRRPLKYIGFDGLGHQVRDCLHPDDLFALIDRQVSCSNPETIDPVVNVSGGQASAISLRQLSDWCVKRWGPHDVDSDRTQRQFDVPWLVLDNTKAQQLWGWTPTRSVDSILEEIACFADRHPDWLKAWEG